MEQRKSLAEMLKPTLTRIEDTLWFNELATPPIPIRADKEILRSSLKIFSTMMVDIMFRMQMEENMDKEDVLIMADSMGKDIQKLVYKYTNIKTDELYDDKR